MDDTKPSDARHISRLLAVQYLFTRLKSVRAKQELEVFEPQTILSILEEKKFNSQLYEKIVEGVIDNEDKIDQIISERAPAWPLDQINPVDLIILRVAIWEGLFYKKTPFRVIINEAIELDKVLSSKESSGFINGVLGKLLTEEKNESS